ncbi:MAG: DNA-directed RNA polymerase subunit H [Nanoarchaeota archaeon]|nr:DNA-directed RNA polymerase subunit H [Nanoarchaeota archaeon]
MSKQKFDIKKHILVPKQSKLSEKDKKALLEKYKVSVYDLPLIKKGDSAIGDLDVQAGDVIRIIRESPTAGEAIFYRCVVNG